MEDPAVIILGLFDTTGDMRGCIFSTPLADEVSLANQSYPNVRVIEGLCVHRSHRKKGIAGYLISAMDYETSKKGPVIHLYSRELTTVPFASTHLHAKTYAYIECSAARTKHSVSKMDIDLFRSLWDSNKSGWSSTDIVCSPSLRRGDMVVWLCNQSVIVVANTRRRSRTAKFTIWETVWCGKLLSGKLYPSQVQQEEVESIAAMHSGLLFTMCENFTEQTERAPWRIGRSGMHVWYIYNFITPKFGSCEIQCIREEI